MRGGISPKTTILMVFVLFSLCLSILAGALIMMVSRQPENQMVEIEEVSFLPSEISITVRNTGKADAHVTRVMIEGTYYIVSELVRHNTTSDIRVPVDWTPNTTYTIRVICGNGWTSEGTFTSP